MLLLYTYVYEMHFSSYLHALLGRPRVVFSRSRLRGTQGGRAYATGHVWVPAGLPGARSGRSKRRDLPSNHRIAFRLAEPRRTMETPQIEIFAAAA